MGGACRVNGQRLCVTYIGEMGDKLQVIDELFSRGFSSFNTKDHHTAKTDFKLPGSDFVCRVIFRASHQMGERDRER